MVFANLIFAALGGRLVGYAEMGDFVRLPTVKKN